MGGAVMKNCDCRSTQLCGTRGVHHRPWTSDRCSQIAVYAVSIGDALFSRCADCLRDDDNIVEQLGQEVRQ